MTAPPSPAVRRIAWTLRGLAIAFLAFDMAIKVIQSPMAIDGTTALGYPASAVLLIGLIELTCLVLYVIPATSVIGALLFTGYLGGAVATHVRLGNPLFSHVLFPVYVALLLWAGLYLQEPRLRALIPIRR